jgi:hypothetical protein
MPHKCLTIRAAMDAAVAMNQSGTVETAWSDAGVMPGDPTWAGGTLFVDRREVVTSATHDAVWKAVTGLGGDRGYYACNWLWQLRGIMDSFIGGPGLRRGRRCRDELRLGDALDFWRVTAIDPPRRLELTAEMKMPGLAWLEFKLEETATGTRLTQRAIYAPKGLLGHMYWASVWPMHGIVFPSMARHAALGSKRK